MKLLNERVLIREVAQRWAAQYADAFWRNDKEKQEVGRKLKALDVETATAADVAAIIGNGSWTRIHQCDECGAEGPTAVVRFGDGTEYPADVCLPCLHKAVKLASGVSAGQQPAFVAGPGFPISGVSTWRTGGPDGALVRICEANNNADCAHGCNVGPCRYAPQHTPSGVKVDAPPSTCKGDPGECTFNGACMYACGNRAELREWERIAVERAADYGAALYVQPREGAAADRVRAAEAQLRQHLRARPAGVPAGTRKCDRCDGTGSVITDDEEWPCPQCAGALPRADQSKGGA